MDHQLTSNNSSDINFDYAFLFVNDFLLDLEKETIHVHTYIYPFILKILLVRKPKTFWYVVLNSMRFLFFGYWQKCIDWSMNCIKWVSKDYVFPWFFSMNNMKQEKYMKTPSQKMDKFFFVLEWVYLVKYRRWVILKLLALLTINI